MATIKLSRIVSGGSGLSIEAEEFELMFGPNFDTYRLMKFGPIELGFSRSKELEFLKLTSFELGSQIENDIGLAVGQSIQAVERILHDLGLQFLRQPVLEIAEIRLENGGAFCFGRSGLFCYSCFVDPTEPHEIINNVVLTGEASVRLSHLSKMFGLRRVEMAGRLYEGFEE